MTYSPFDLMQSAVDIVHTSPHPTNKIAATLACADGTPLSRTNFWPSAIEETIGHYQKIGSSSGTIHAETACIFSAQHTHKAKIYLTDPPCPNCMKNMAEAGISEIYIDHKGFDKDFAQRRGDHFDKMSMRIAERAGISVFEIYRKDEKISPIFKPAENYRPIEENPVDLKPVNADKGLHTAFADHIKETHNRFFSPFACSFTTDGEDHIIALTTIAHPVIGYSSKAMDPPDDKYSFIMEPMNRLLMSTAKHGLTLITDYIFCSRVPTSREQVNLVGAGVSAIMVGEHSQCRDEYGLIAKNLLEKNEILGFKNLHD